MTTTDVRIAPSNDVSEPQSASSLARMWTSIRDQVRARRAVRKHTFEFMEPSVWRASVASSTNTNVPR